MKEIKIKISDDDYKRLLRIATLDAIECGNEIAHKAEEDRIQFAGKYAIDCALESGEAYWGEYNEEDY